MSETLDRPAAHDTAGNRQFVTFHVCDEIFGVPLGGVQEIIRMPGLVQMPLSPPTLEGIANLRGTVLPIINLRRVFGTQEAPHDDATRVVVVNRGGVLVGFVVDRMASVITAETSEVESAATLEATIGSGMLEGVVKRSEGMIMLLDPERLSSLGEASTPDGARSGRANFSAAGSETSRSQAESIADEIQLVSFEAAGQEYAFPIDDVQEIVQVPSHVSQMPQARSEVVGVMSLRDRLLPLVSLRRMFGLSETPLDDQSRIIVVSPGGRDAPSIGIVTDTVKEVLRVNRLLVDKVPPLLATNAAGETDLESICRLDGGKRLVTILSARKMFRDAELRQAIDTAASGHDQPEIDMQHRDGSAETSGIADQDDEEQFVVFHLAGEEYGVRVASVQEIVRVPEQLTHVPKTASFIEGIVNLRGSVLPVVDQRRRFTLEGAERNDHQRIMVLTIAGIRTGFIVDQVTEVLRIKLSAIVPAPRLSDEQAKLISRVANLERQKRMILLLDADKLLEATELETMSAL